MAKKFTLAELTAGTIEARLADYAMGMADGEVSLLVDVLQELGVSNSGSSQAAAKGWCPFSCKRPRRPRGAMRPDRKS